MTMINNNFRFIDIPATVSDVPYRTEFSRDYARVIHSPSFRRLASKTQLFPGQESDFFRNRLTHSLEVAQIAKSIAERLLAIHPSLDIFPEVCEIAGLMHDVGHPPFGHNGEKALDKCMLGWGGFEGNAQTLRIITRLEKKECPPKIIDARKRDCRAGLNLTARVIASALKYDEEIPVTRVLGSPLVKGYYNSEKTIVEKVKASIIDDCEIEKFKTIECSIMDIADDIAYSTYDLEDAFKSEFLTPNSIIAADDSIFDQIVEKLEKDSIHVTRIECRRVLSSLFGSIWAAPMDLQKHIDPNDPDFSTATLENYFSMYNRSSKLAQDGYIRTSFTSSLVNKFINGVNIIINADCPVLSRAEFTPDILLCVNILKHFAFVSLINSSRFKVAENRGQEIVTRMFEKLHDEKGVAFLPPDFQKLYFMMPDDLSKARVVCDFIAGMTDRYAHEFYERLFSENPQTIFRPLY